MKKTRRSLFTSIVTLLLCSAMFVGSTFAWFTDTVSNTGNKIQAGTLDVELWQKTDSLSTAQSADEKVKEITEEGYTEYSNISDSTIAVFNYDKWEPGYATSLPFAVVNVGNLAFKYNIYFYITEETPGTHETSTDTSLLSNVIKVYKGTSREDTKVEANYLGTLADFTKEGATGHKISGKLLPKGSTKKLDEEQVYIASSDLVFIMPEEAGNEYQGASLTFDIRVEATQYTYEEDGFGSNLYDDNSTLEPDSAQPSYATATVENDKPTTFVVHGDNIAKNATNNTTIEFPIGALTKQEGKAGESEVEIIATPILTANKSFKVTSDNGAVGAIDLTVTVDGEQVNSFNNQEVTVTTYIAKGLTLNGNADKVGVEYDGEGGQPTFISYNSATGELKFKTKHFSTFLIDADQVAYVESNNTAYLNLNDAIENAQENQEIFILKNATVGFITANKDTIINLNNYVLSNTRFFVEGGISTTLRNGTVTKTGYVADMYQGVLNLENVTLESTESGSGAAVYIDGSTDPTASNYTVLNLDPKSKIIAKGEYALAMYSNGSWDTGYGIVINLNGSVDSLYGLGINGLFADKSSAIININESADISTGIYAAAKATWNIKGTVHGTVYQKCGTVNIFDTAEIYASHSDEGKWSHAQSGYVTTGDCIIVESCNYSGGQPTLNVSGGTFHKQVVEGERRTHDIMVIEYLGDVATINSTYNYYLAELLEEVTDENPIIFTDANTRLIEANNN